MVLTTLDCTPKALGWKLVLPLPPRPPLPPVFSAPADDDFVLLFSALRFMISSKLRFKASSAILPAAGLRFRTVAKELLQCSVAVKETQAVIDQRRAEECNSNNEF